MAQAGAALTVFALIRNDGFWWERKAGGTGSHELCHKATTSAKFTAVPSNSVSVSCSDYVWVLWAASNDENGVSFQCRTHGREALKGATVSRFNCLKVFYPILSF